MTATTDDPRGARLPLRVAVPRLPLMVAIATLLTLALNWPVARAALGGAFADPDDALRLVEVRAWMAGQPWFDLRAMRLDPPFGASMHWSRLVDVPNAILISLFEPFTKQAEGWDRIVLPTLLLAALYAGIVRLASVLLERPARQSAHVTALLGTFLSGVTLVQFQPGRIGHHAPETVALVWAVASALASLDRSRAKQGALAGALVALSLAISLETLPFVATLCAALLVLWVFRGPVMVPALRSFALGLGAALALLFLGTIAHHAWFSPVCDAFGAPYAGAAAIFAVGSLGIANWSAPLPTSGARLAGATVVGIAVATFVALAYPACLHGPFAGVDPLVRDIWLDHVVESWPLLTFLRERPAIGLAISLPTALGTLCCLIAAYHLRGLAAQRFAVLAGLGALGLAAGFWQVRVFASVAPLALCGGLFAVSTLRDRLIGRGLRIAAAMAPMAILPFTATGWALVFPTTEAIEKSVPSCLAPSALQPLNRLPPGRIVAPVDSGSHLLEATHHTVFAAPYHRNNDGNRFAFDVMLAPPAKAQALLADRHVAYVMTCEGLGETSRLAARAPDSLAAQLQQGQIPAFLQPLALTGTPYRVYAVQAAGP